jgi:hypothetical protein
MDTGPDDKPSIDDRDAFIRWQLKEMQKLNASIAQQRKLTEAQSTHRLDDTNATLLALLNRMDQKLDEQMRGGESSHA